MARLLTLLVGLPLLGALGVMRFSFVIGRFLGLSLSLLLALVGLSVLAKYDASGVGASLRGGAQLFSLLILLVPLDILVANDRASVGAILLLEALLLLALLSADGMVFFVLFEACTVPILILVTSGANWHRKTTGSAVWGLTLRHKINAAYRMAIITLLASLFFVTYARFAASD